MDTRNSKDFPDLLHKNQRVIGMAEVFSVGDYQKVECALDQLQELGITDLRTKILWADYFTDAGKEWYDWLIPVLARKINLLPCFVATPPAIGIRPTVSSPPVNPKEFADFLDVILTKYDPYFDWVELWNEPNNIREYDYTLDKNWETFCKMVGGAAFWMRKNGKKILLGGMNPIDPNWLQLMYDRGIMKYIDAISLHGFPKVFDNYWPGWAALIDSISQIKQLNSGEQQIWITEAGFSTWQHDEKGQLREFIDMLDAPADRSYWYSINDLEPAAVQHQGYAPDDRQLHFGMLQRDGTPKLLYRLLKENGLTNIRAEKWLTDSPAPVLKKNRGQYPVLITGGAGFIGINLADALLSEGKDVIIYDNLSRKGVEKNLHWLKSKHKKNLSIHIADIRNEHLLREAVNAAGAVYHFAAQVAVTSSCVNPILDFEVNARGTLNLLEAIRQSERQPPLVFTSTNKVYGGLEDLKVILKGSRYVPANPVVASNGVSEHRAIDFHSPYGCSKGAADAYILDFARTFDLKAVVFRMSCIYGPHQFGTEDQGWVAHFLISSLEGKPITIYGDGKQVRDILYVKDLVKALEIAMSQMEKFKGQAYNIGGGAKNTISLLELVKIIEDLQHEPVDIEFGDWRTGDQKYYVSDITKFRNRASWIPEVSAYQGIKDLYLWLLESGNIPLTKYSVT